MENQMFSFYKNALSGVIAEPLCEEYKNEWRGSQGDKQKLVALAMRQQSIPYFATACYLGKGLTQDYIAKEFGDYINGYTLRDVEGVNGYTYGLYVDYDYDNDLVANKDVIHVMHTIGATIVVPQTKCPTLYVSNRSKVHLVCEGFNHVIVYLFDKSKLTIEDADENTDVVVYEYSNMCDVDLGKYCLGKIKTHRKELRL